MPMMPSLPPGDVPPVQAPYEEPESHEQDQGDDFPEEDSRDLAVSAPELPWFFRFIWLFVHGVIILSAVIFAVGMLALVAAWLNTDATSSVLAAALTWTLYGLTVVFVCAAMLLLHDMAVSFRSLRVLADLSERRAEALRARAESRPRS
jgi:hypothetical protein